MIPFDPLFRNPHVQTIAAHFWPRDGGERRFPVSARLYRTEPDVEVLVHSQHPDASPAGEVVIVHGLEGSGEAGYVRGLSAAVLRAGFAPHRFHMRTCGGTEQLCRTLYHAGLTSDLESVLRRLRAEGSAPLYLVGFSLGGNVVLKLAGELELEAPNLICAVCAISPPLDLAACVRRMGQRENRIYERRFAMRMRKRLAATGRYGPAELAGLRSVFDIDDRITAPSFGFGDAATYYRTQSAAAYLNRIRVPTLIIHAKDDPLVPIESCQSASACGNPYIEHWVTAHGGHLGFLGRKPHRFWLDEAIMEWVLCRNAINARSGL
jgi:predicted alpha/beta-fold hydrolase